jgi:hypothetical protein
MCLQLGFAPAAVRKIIAAPTDTTSVSVREIKLRFQFYGLGSQGMASDGKWRTRLEPGARDLDYRPGKSAPESSAIVLLDPYGLPLL